MVTMRDVAKEFAGLCESPLKGVSAIRSRE